MKRVVSIFAVSLLAGAIALPTITMAQDAGSAGSKWDNGTPTGTGSAGYDSGISSPTDPGGAKRAERGLTHWDNGSPTGAGSAGTDGGANSPSNAGSASDEQRLLKGLNHWDNGSPSGAGSAGTDGGSAN